MFTRQRTVASCVAVIHCGRQRTNLRLLTGIAHTGHTTRRSMESMMMRASESVMPSVGLMVVLVLPRMKLRPTRVFNAS